MASSTSQAAPVWDHPDGDEGGNRQQHGHGEEVLEEADERQVTDEGNVEIPPEEGTEGLDDGEDQDSEAPHGEEMGHAGHGPLKQLLLAGNLDEFGLQSGRNVLGPAGHGGLPGCDEPAQPEKPPASDGKHHKCDSESQNDSDGHCGSS
jgi:hypothetical protein